MICRSRCPHACVFLVAHGGGAQKERRCRYQPAKHSCKHLKSLCRRSVLTRCLISSMLTEERPRAITGNGGPSHSAAQTHAGAMLELQNGRSIDKETKKLASASAETVREVRTGISCFPTSVTHPFLPHPFVPPPPRPPPLPTPPVP